MEARGSQAVSITHFDEMMDRQQTYFLIVYDAKLPYHRSDS